MTNFKLKRLFSNICNEIVRPTALLQSSVRFVINVKPLYWECNIFSKSLQLRAQILAPPTRNHCCLAMPLILLPKHVILLSLASFAFSSFLLFGNCARDSRFFTACLFQSLLNQILKLRPTSLQLI